MPHTIHTPRPPPPQAASSPHKHPQRTSAVAAGLREALTGDSSPQHTARTARTHPHHDSRVTVQVNRDGTTWSEQGTGTLHICDGADGGARFVVKGTHPSQVLIEEHLNDDSYELDDAERAVLWDTSSGDGAAQVRVRLLLQDAAFYAQTRRWLLLFFYDDHTTDPLDVIAHHYCATPQVPLATYKLALCRPAVALLDRDMLAASLLHHGHLTRLLSRKHTTERGPLFEVLVGVLSLGSPAVLKHIFACEAFADTFFALMSGLLDGKGKVVSGVSPKGVKQLKCEAAVEASLAQIPAPWRAFEEVQCIIAGCARARFFEFEIVNVVKGGGGAACDFTHVKAAFKTHETRLKEDLVRFCSDHIDVFCSDDSLARLAFPLEILFSLTDKDVVGHLLKQLLLKSNLLDVGAVLGGAEHSEALCGVLQLLVGRHSEARNELPVTVLRELLMQHESSFMGTLTSLLLAPCGDAGTLYHLLGLHENEGLAQERTLHTGINTVRSTFLTHFYATHCAPLLTALTQQAPCSEAITHCAQVFACSLNLHSQEHKRQLLRLIVSSRLFSSFTGLNGKGAWQEKEAMLGAMKMCTAMLKAFACDTEAALCSVGQVFCRQLCRSGFLEAVLRLVDVAPLHKRGILHGAAATLLSEGVQADVNAATAAAETLSTGSSPADRGAQKAASEGVFRSLRSYLVALRPAQFLAVGKKVDMNVAKIYRTIGSTWRAEEVASACAEEEEEVEVETAAPPHLPSAGHDTSNVTTTTSSPSPKKSPPLPALCTHCMRSLEADTTPKSATPRMSPERPHVGSIPLWKLGGVSSNDPSTPASDSESSVSSAQEYHNVAGGGGGVTAMDLALNDSILNMSTDGSDLPLSLYEDSQASTSSSPFTHDADVDMDAIERTVTAALAEVEAEEHGNDHDVLAHLDLDMSSSLDSPSPQRRSRHSGGGALERSRSTSTSRSRSLCASPAVLRSAEYVSPGGGVGRGAVPMASLCPSSTPYLLPHTLSLQNLSVNNSLIDDAAHTVPSDGSDLGVCFWSTPA